jgi:hypothetical protein
LVPVVAALPPVAGPPRSGVMMLPVPMPLAEVALPVAPQGAVVVGDRV